MSFLDEMAAASRARVDAAAAPLAELKARASAARPVRLPRVGAFELIAEVKRVAPSAGVLAAPPGDRAAFAVGQARAYAAAGAALLSVLTEPARFDGALVDLAAVAAAVDVPAMRKDFLVDPYQVWEARAVGADAVLLIVRMLTPDGLRALCDTAASLGMLVLLEAFDEVDLARCAALASAWPAAAPLWVGVNTRDLATLQVDPHRLARLAPHLPAGVPAVAESGIVGPGDAAAAARLGYRVALVGTALMRAPDPTALAASLLQAGRAASP